MLTYDCNPSMCFTRLRLLVSWLNTPIDTLALVLDLKILFSQSHLLCNQVWIPYKIVLDSCLNCLELVYSVLQVNHKSAIIISVLMFVGGLLSSAPQWVHHGKDLGMIIVIFEYRRNDYTLFWTNKLFFSLTCVSNLMPIDIHSLRRSFPHVPPPQLFLQIPLALLVPLDCYSSIDSYRTWLSLWNGWGRLVICKAAAVACYLACFCYWKKI